MDEEDKQNLLNKGIISQTKYLIKWKGLSYLQSTWEPEEEISEFSLKLKDFQRHNRAMLKDQRMNFLNRLQKHTELLHIHQAGQKKVQKIHPSVLWELKRVILNFKP
jgi:hypothetical protein